MADVNNLVNTSYFGNIPNQQLQSGVVNVGERIGVFQRTYQLNINSLAESLSEAAKKLVENINDKAFNNAKNAYEASVKNTNEVAIKLDSKINDFGSKTVQYVNEISNNIYSCFMGLANNLKNLEEDINKKINN